MKQKYDQIKVPHELKVKIKTAAAKKNKTIIQFLKELLKK